MAKRAAPYRIFDRDGRGFAWIDVRSIPGMRRVREPLRDAQDQPIAYRAERTGRGPSRAAEEAAARRYTDLVRGRVVGASDRIMTAMTDEELVAAWLDGIETPANKKSVNVKGTYGRTWHAFFGDASRRDDGGLRWPDGRTALERMVSDAGPHDYAMHRLTRVTRKTVRKELVALFEFFTWAKLHHAVRSIPPRPELPKNDPGVRSGKQRANPVDIEPAEARAIVAALPEWSKAANRKKPRKGEHAFRVRAPHAFMWEMGWRPSTIARLSVPENWSPGLDEVELHDGDDKARYGRTVKITARAKAILEECAPERGLIFGEHDYRAYIKAAALTVLPEAKATKFARYDFRHGRINNLLETTGDLQGVGYVVGHKQVTTTNAYVRARRRQGDAVIDAADAAASPLQGGTMRARAAASNEKPTEKQSGRVDSNHRPLDPQRTRIAQGLGIVAGGTERGPAKTSTNPARQDAIGARSGHAVLTEADRALAIESAIWDAFDTFALHAAGVDVDIDGADDAGGSR